MSGATDMEPEAPTLDALDELTGGERLIVDVAGFEGPLDLLLALARTQKLDLTQISMAALADQYLQFIERADKLRLEIAADYLVMAAWLAYLKSRLLLPKPEAEPGPSGEEMAAMLAFRLQRLGAMRDAAARLMARDLLGRSVFQRGSPEGVRVTHESRYSASLYDLLKAYADQRKRKVASHMTISRRFAWSIKEARSRIERLFGSLPDWCAFDDLLVRYLGRPEEARTAMAASLGALLELTREGRVELQQGEPFSPLYVRDVRRLHLVRPDEP